MEAAISTLPDAPPLIPWDTGVVLLVLAGIVLLLAAARLIRIRMRERREEVRELPPLVYPAVRRVAPPPGRAPIHDAAAPSGEHVTFNSAAPAVRIHREAVRSENGGRPVQDSPGMNGGAQAVEAEGSDATLQLLPGRLEPVDPGIHQEVRFIRVPGMNRFTLGRNAGPAHTHIQLRAATASRMHAYMIFEDGRWHLGNMSQTNRVVLNGMALNGDAARPLADGDRIEFGELTFVFRER